jgi:RNA polymerase sigma factor (sigma-70 family)
MAMGRDRPLDPKHVKIARRMARAFMRRLPSNVQADDLEQAALLGIVDAMRRRPNDSGAAFDWYVCVRIRGEILDELRRQDWASRRRRHGPAPPTIIRFDDLDERWEELFEGPSSSPEASAITRCDADKAWETPLPPRMRAVMTERFQRGRRQEDVANDAGVSAPRICQLERRALGAMRMKLTGQSEPAVLPLAERRAIWQARFEAGKR